MQLRKADPRPVKELLQGSIFEIEKLSFLYEGETFTLKQFYPEVDLTGVRHGIVMTQSCDLVSSEGGRKIKVPYITIGFLEPFHRHIQREEDWSRVVLPWPIVTDQGPENYTIVCRELFESALEDSLSKLLQNNAKNHFFFAFEDEPPQTRYYTVNLTKAFPIQSRHYKELLPAVSYELHRDFAHKLGWKIAELYGRADTEDYEETKAESVLGELYGIIEAVANERLPNPLPIDSKRFAKALAKKGSAPYEKGVVLAELMQSMRDEQDAERLRVERKAAKDAAFYAKQQKAAAEAELKKE